LQTLAGKPTDEMDDIALCPQQSHLKKEDAQANARDPLANRSHLVTLTSERSSPRASIISKPVKGQFIARVFISLGAGKVKSTYVTSASVTRLLFAATQALKASY